MLFGIWVFFGGRGGGGAGCWCTIHVNTWISAHKKTSIVSDFFSLIIFSIQHSFSRMIENDVHVNSMNFQCMHNRKSSYTHIQCIQCINAQPNLQMLWLSINVFFFFGNFNQLHKWVLIFWAQACKNYERFAFQKSCKSFCCNFSERITTKGTWKHIFRHFSYISKMTCKFIMLRAFQNYFYI